MIEWLEQGYDEPGFDYGVRRPRYERDCHDVGVVRWIRFSRPVCDARGGGNADRSLGRLARFPILEVR